MEQPQSMEDLAQSFDPSLNRFDYRVNEQLDWQNEVLVIVNVRLGFDQVNPSFYPSLVRCTKFSSFVGLVGGKPAKAFYFFGHS